MLVSTTRPGFSLKVVIDAPAVLQVVAAALIGAIDPISYRVYHDISDALVPIFIKHRLEMKLRKYLC